MPSNSHRIRLVLEGDRLACPLTAETIAGDSAQRPIFPMSSNTRPKPIRSTAEFARYVGLARTTVSRVLNGQLGLEQKTIDRTVILRGMWTYRPGSGYQSARALGPASDRSGSKRPDHGSGHRRERRLEFRGQPFGGNRWCALAARSERPHSQKSGDPR